MKIRGQTVYSLQDRIERLVVQDKTTWCWEWQGALRNGYGRLIIGSRSDGTRKSVSAHRLSYEVFKGNIPDGFYVCHRCDNRKCVNPAHLWLGRHQDNVDDRENKGRNKLPRKLTDKQVSEIHNFKGIKTSKTLAKEYGVSYWTIKNIWVGKSYHELLPLPPTGEKTLRQLVGEMKND